MNITIVTDVLGEANNGTTLAALNLIETLRKKGHNVKVVCADRMKSGEEGYYVLPTIDFKIFNGYVKKNGVVLAKCQSDILEEACKDADIVHSLLPFQVGRSAVKYCVEHNIPVTTGFHAQAENVTSHLFAMNIKIINRLTYQNLWRKYYKYVNAIHFPTQFICDLVKKYGIEGKDSYVISNGVQTDLFYPKKVERPPLFRDKFIIIMSGRLTKEKNQINLLRAAKKSKYSKDIQVILCGDGPRRAKLLKYGFKNLQNPPIIRSFPHEQLADILRMGDLYVHTSLVEIEAISCLESLACGLVPVISDSPRSATSKFALHEESRYKHGSTKDLAKKIDWWIEHPEERKKAAKEYAAFAKQFDFNACMDKMEQMLIETKNKYDLEHNGKK